ncbi:MAG TPA: D-alanyl-D-alanine carboxypeptidase/D-alanyl-D-alanine-endopeptidase [Chitinophagaceae bacterium]|jgi:D-alanyl-D-alanine carboxypeptidase/D-alanyl-D-alanine-endopeptidase (penicillin-binding protein 4)|nr:D-alanyl-D-alanine carboxypeptidase/D-alanyl-D-alanine-endopeptidase [Chitinophagaceae bacterium]
MSYKLRVGSSNGTKSHRGIAQPVTHNFKRLTLLFSLIVLISSCSVQKKIGRSARIDVINTKPLQAAHVGLCIFDPSTNKYLYNYQGDKYFVPASNTKIPTCYAAMKYLGDSLTAALILDMDTAVVVIPTGDPSLLHTDFKNQPLVEMLRKEKRPVYIAANNWEDEPLGSGWSWNDYDQAYMAERSPLPVYGNVLEWVQEITDSTKPPLIYSNPEINWEVDFSDDSARNFSVRRDIGSNFYTLNQGSERKKVTVSIPFFTNGIESAVELLKDATGNNRLSPANTIFVSKRNAVNTASAFHSQPTDSLLKPMMHRSDNFFAEQSLLMVSNERLGVMNDAKIIDTLLKTDFKDLPQKPRWVDGSGLSRYNLFTPQDLVAILNKMKDEFGMERIKVIFATGGEGTISSYYKADSGYIYGKTGTLSGVVAFSGFLYTKKGKLLIFSTLVNNHQASATDVRRAIEKFLQGIRNTY